MTIFNNTASHTLTLVQNGVEAGSQNPPWSGKPGHSVATLGGDFLPGRSELFDYNSQLGSVVSPVSRSSNISPGLFAVSGAVSILTASSTVTFTNSTVDVEKSKPRTADHTITFTQTNARAGAWSPTAASTITFSQTDGVAAPRDVSASNSLSLTQTSSSGLFTRSAWSTVAFTQFGQDGKEKILTAGNTLALVQTSSSGFYSRSAWNSLSLTQTNSRIFASALAAVLTASNTLVPSDSTQRVLIKVTAIGLTASHTLTMAQRAIFPIELTASGSITFTDAADGVPGKSGTQTLDLVQTVILNQVRDRTASDTLALTHVFTYVQLRDGVPIVGLGDCDATRQYAPLSGGDGSPSVRPIAPSLNRQTDVVLFSPTGGICDASSSITLRTPNFGDRDRNQYNRINRESRGGSLTVFRDPQWPSERTLVMDFSGMKDSQVDTMVTFLEDTLGQKVGLRDWHGRVWFGLIVNPDTAIVRTGTNRNDISIELEVDDTELELQACSSFALSQTNAREVV